MSVRVRILAKEKDFRLLLLWDHS